MHQQQFNQQLKQQSRIKQDLANVVDDVERVLRDLPEVAGDVKQRATIRLGELRNRLNEVEPFSAAGQRAASYVRQNPWMAIGGAAAAAFAIGLLSRRNH